MARNEESGTGEARIKKEECGEFVSFLSPFSYSRTHLPTPSALLFLHRTPCTQPLARIRPAAMAQDASNAVFPTDGAIFFLFFSFFPFFKKKYCNWGSPAVRFPPEGPRQPNPPGV